MFKDLKDISFNSPPEYDICIVGSGPAGVSLAKTLLNTNYKISILESGGLEPEDEYQELNEGENSGPSFLSLYSSRLRCFGGAGKLWAGHCAPYKKDEFMMKVCWVILLKKKVLKSLTERTLYYLLTFFKFLV